jgi:hypothetical protein
MQQTFRLNRLAAVSHVRDWTIIVSAVLHDAVAQ